jgi:hypothetical protein
MLIIVAPNEIWMLLLRDCEVCCKSLEVCELVNEKG